MVVWMMRYGVCESGAMHAPDGENEPKCVSISKIGRVCSLSIFTQRKGGMTLMVS